MLFVFRIDLAQLAANLNQWDRQGNFDIDTARRWLICRVEDEPSPFRLFAMPDEFISEEDPALYLASNEILSTEAMPV